MAFEEHDGRDRYVNWYNQVKSTPFDSSPLANEHFEDWPSKWGSF